MYLRKGTIGMTITEIKKTLDNLLYYKDVEITHTVKDYALSYCKESNCFIIENMENGKVYRYEETGGCLTALNRIINNKAIEIAE